MAMTKDEVVTNLVMQLMEKENLLDIYHRECQRLEKERDELKAKLNASAPVEDIA